LAPFPDLILCGQQTIDSDTGHVGSQIAEELNLPQVCGVNEIHPENSLLSVKRLNDGFLDTLRTQMPVLLTVSKDLCISRHIPMGNLERAFSNRKVIQWGMDKLSLKEDEVGLMGSATQVWRLHKPPPKKEGEVITGPPQALVEQVIKKLEALSILDEEKRHE
jgi:electron transfer flavoprotein beta subunit